MTTTAPSGSPPSQAGTPLMIDQWALFRSVDFGPHPGQVDLLQDPRRFIVASCGRRFGKSEAGGHKLLPEVFLTLPMKDYLLDQRKRREFWITGPNYSDSEKEFRVLWNQLKKLEVPFDKPGSYNNPIQGEMHISLWDGTFQVHGKSAAHPESLVGEGNSGIIVAEAAKVKHKVWVKYLRPTLNDFRGWAFLSSTPEGKNWFYDYWKQGQDPNFKSWGSYRMPAWVNPYVYPHGATDEGVEQLFQLLKSRQMVDDEVALAHGVDPEIAELMMSMTEEAFNQEIAADFTEFVGRVFKGFDEEDHVADLAFNPEWKTYAAVDYGFRNPNVWLLLQIDPFDEYINVLGEVYEQGLDPEEFADAIASRKLRNSPMSLAPRETLAFFPDPASPGDTNVLTRKLRIESRPHTGGDLSERLKLIRRKLGRVRPDRFDERPMIQFDRSCTRSISDFLNYRYPDTKDEQDKNAPENPLKKDDHAPEALGRFMAGYFGTNEQKPKQARSSQASFSRR